MENFMFYNPTRIVFGKDTVNEVGKHCLHEHAHNVLIVYGGAYVEESGLLDIVKMSLRQYQLTYAVYSNVLPNPCVSHVAEALKIAKASKCDFVLAIGGGSAIDVAKGVATMMKGQPIIDALLGKIEITDCLPIGVISTIAGSGSESSCSLILTIDETKQKRALDSDLIRPRFAIMDPTLTYSLPKHQMVAGGCDILMHTLERYFTPTTSDTLLIDTMSEGLLTTVMNAMKTAIMNPNDYDARATLMWAGSLSHNGLLETGRMSDWATHRLEHELSGMFDVIHGDGLCALWGTWARHVYKSDLKRFARFATHVMKVNDDGNDEQIALQGIHALENFFVDVGMPITVHDLNIHITKQDIEIMCDNCLLNCETIGHFQELKREDIRSIYEKADKERSNEN